MSGAQDSVPDPARLKIGRHSIADLARGVGQGELSARSLVAESLERIEASQSTLNAFRLVCERRARIEAAEADRTAAEGKSLPLLGVPVAVKDDIDVAGEPTSYGCGGTFAPKASDAQAVRLLRAAGAVIVGKTNAPELCQWPFTGGSAFGRTYNPWSSQHTPGGSSGGAAAAVAAGLVPAALGSDGGGSIRIPAAWTNLVGIKPQRDRVSTWPEVDSLQGMTVLGALARTVADAALLVDVVSGASGSNAEAAGAQQLSAGIGADIGRLRIAMALRAPFTTSRVRLHPEVHAGVARIGTALRTLGHTVEVADLAYDMRLSLSVFTRLAVGFRQRLQTLPAAEVDSRTRAKVRAGLLLSGPALRAARAVEPRLQRRIGRIFRDFDIVLAPTTSTPPPLVDYFDGRSWLSTERTVAAACPYAFPWNALGWPSVNVPAGFTESGLPVGAQLMGPAASDRLLISVAAQLESQLRWDLYRPEPWWRQ